MVQFVLNRRETTMRTGRPLPELVLSVEENNRLVEWTRRHKTSQALALRSRIILACAEKVPNKEVAKRLRITKSTVGKWRSRFIKRRLDGLLDEPRRGRRARSMMLEWNACLQLRLMNARAMRRTGVRARWRAGSSFRRAQCAVCGVPLGCNRIVLRPLSCRPIRCLLARCAILSACI